MLYGVKFFLRTLKILALLIFPSELNKQNCIVSSFESIDSKPIFFSFSLICSRIKEHKNSLSSKKLLINPE